MPNVQLDGAVARPARLEQPAPGRVRTRPLPHASFFFIGIFPELPAGRAIGSTGRGSGPQPGPRLRLYLFAAARAGASGGDICMKKRGWLPCCRDGDPGGDTGAEEICRPILPAAAGIRNETRSKRPPASGAGIWQGCHAVADGRFDGGARVRRREGRGRRIRHSLVLAARIARDWRMTGSGEGDASERSGGAGAMGIRHRPWWYG